MIAFFVCILFSFSIEDTTIYDIDSIGTVLLNETNLTINHK